jgi:hypothetical protein
MLESENHPVGGRQRRLGLGTLLERGTDGPVDMVENWPHANPLRTAAYHFPRTGSASIPPSIFREANVAAGYRRCGAINIAWCKTWPACRRAPFHDLIRRPAAIATGKRIHGPAARHSTPTQREAQYPVEAARVAREHKAYLIAAEAFLGLICIVALVICARRFLRRLPRARPVNMPDPPC